MRDEHEGSDRSDLFEQVTCLVEDQLLLRAAEVDQGDGFPSDNIAAISRLGLFGLMIPADAGGLGVTSAESRKVLRLLSSGCGATAFAFAQHHGATAAVAATKNAELKQRWLPRLLDNTLAGTAFAHVRRPGTPVLRAVADGDDWVLSGVAPWVTSWGQAEVMTVAATTDDGRLVWVLLPARETPGLCVEKRFALMVFQATQTVALRFDALVVDAASVLNVHDIGPWAERDQVLSARPSPLCLGIGDRALTDLQEVAPEVAASMAPWWSTQHEAAEEQCRRVDGAIANRAIDDDLASATAAGRSAALLSVQKLTTALLAATGGSAIERGQRAQRLSREALFYVIQAQSPVGKAATLEALDPS